MTIKSVRQIVWWKTGRAALRPRFSSAVSQTDRNDRRRCVALPIEYGLHAAFAVVEVGIMNAAQFQTSGVFLPDRVVVTVLLSEDPLKSLRLAL